MPKRTNEFQQLVHLIQKALAPKGAKISQSAMVPNAAGVEREIDVLVEGEFGPYRMKIAVEAKGHSRALDLTVLEQLAAKYKSGDGLQVNQVVVVAKSGFTKDAGAFGERNNMKLLTLREAENADWKQYIKPGTKQKLFFALPPKLIRYEFLPRVTKDVVRLASYGEMVCMCCGRRKGTVANQVSHFLRCHMSKIPDFKTMMNQLRQTGGSCVAHITNELRPNTGILFEGQRFAVKTVQFDVGFATTVSPLEFKLFEQVDGDGNATFIQHASASVFGKRFEMVLPNGLQSKQIAISFGDEAKEGGTCDCEDESS